MTTTLAASGKAGGVASLCFVPAELRNKAYNGVPHLLRVLRNKYGRYYGLTAKL